VGGDDCLPAIPASLLAEIPRGRRGRLGFNGREALIDLACGTGEIAFGFSRYVGPLTGVDRETSMIQGAEAAARKHGVNIRLIHSAIEDLPDDAGQFDLVTIGNAHFWLKADAVVDRLDRILTKDGRIFICFANTVGSRDSAWYRAYRPVGRRCARLILFIAWDNRQWNFFGTRHFAPSRRPGSWRRMPSAWIT
jgi:ubiquinone/menaquinone biosynthesis C-methylase UbiE